MKNAPSPFGTVNVLSHVPSSCDSDETSVGLTAFHPALSDAASFTTSPFGVAVICAGESIVMTCSASPGSNDMTLNGTFAATWSVGASPYTQLRPFGRPFGATTVSAVRFVCHASSHAKLSHTQFLYPETGATSATASTSGSVQ